MKFLFLFFTLTLFSFPQQNSYQRFLDLYTINKNVPSISVGVSQNSRTVFSGSSGYSNIENYVPASPRSVYRIASISKMITAIAIMQLVEKKKLNLDDDIRKHLTYFPRKKWNITIRQILNHTSGIRTYRNNEEIHSKTNFEDIKSTVQYFAKDSLMFQPGTNYLYSTLSYNILAAIIEEVSKSTFNDYVRENIFIPAGMLSSFLDFYNTIIPNRASGYIKNGKREIENAPLADLTIKFPGGGIACSIEDIIKLGNSLLNNTLISSQSLDTMITPTKLSTGRVIAYGLGVDCRPDPKGNFYFGHSGGGTGFVSHLLIYPKEKVVAAHLININDKNLENPAMLFAWDIMRTQKLGIPKKSFSDFFLSFIDTVTTETILSLYNNFSVDSVDSYTISIQELKDLGNLLIYYGSTANSISLFQFITKTDTEYVDGYIGLAQAYLKDNNKGLALRSLRKALSLAPNNKSVINLIEKIDGTVIKDQ